MFPPLEALGLNETLRRALLRARLSEEDVAACLEVDPKTVRRWLEGRMPYLRHRWALAGVLGLDEADLWPQLRTVRSRPAEVRAIYPNRDAVPQDVWRRLFGTAKSEIAILSFGALFRIGDPSILGVLSARVQAGVRVRICVREPPSLDAAGEGDAKCAEDASVAGIRDALARYGMSGEGAAAEIRLYRDVMYNCIYRADDEILVGQHAYGIPAGRAPILHLCGTEDDDMIATYLESFERVWAVACLLE